MNNKTKIMLAGGLAGLIALGGAGLAMAGQGQPGGMRHGGGMMNMMNMMERYDANKDGNVSREEVEQNRTSWHGEFDTDKNASLSLQEFQALWLKARHEEMVREFQQFDRDGNGQVTLDEYKAPVVQMVTRMDRNGDGMIGKDDHMRGRGKRHHMQMQDGEDSDTKEDGMQ